MSKLEELIAELCPAGVKYKKLESIGKFTRGKRFVRSDVVDNGIPAIHYGDIYTSYGIWADAAHINIDETLAGKMRYAKKNDVIVVGAGENDMDIGNAVAWLGEEKVAIHDACYIFEHSMDSKYISYYMRSSMYHLQIKKYVSTGKICAISAKGIGQALIPVPPLEVQREIVRILDNFTELTVELTAKLTEELTARKKQYEYYREQLLKHGSIIERPLRELCEIKGRIGFRGYTKNDLVDEGNGAISFSPGNINNETINYTSCTYVSWGKYEESPEIMVEKGDILLCKTGSTLGKVAIIEHLPEKATINPQLVVLKQIRCNSRYLKYILGGYSFQSEMQSRKGLGSVPNISQKEIGSIMIPLHSDKEQQRIVFILDKLNQLCNEISTGLPAEIEARKKQYEYYRDKLLTFKELS